MNVHYEQNLEHSLLPFLALLPPVLSASTDCGCVSIKLQEVQTLIGSSEQS